MNKPFTTETLNELIDTVKTATSQPYRYILTPNQWIYLLKRTPECFRWNNQGELIYGGCKVEILMTLSDSGEKFLAMADKIIPKENRNV